MQTIGDPKGRSDSCSFFLNLEICSGLAPRERVVPGIRLCPTARCSRGDCHRHGAAAGPAGLRPGQDRVESRAK